MLNPTRRTGAGQPGQSDVPDSDLEPPERPKRRKHKPNDWTVRIPASAIDARTAPRGRNGRPISRAKRHLLEILETLCRTQAFCWPKNSTLAAMFDVDERRTQRVLEGLEADGFIFRVQTDGRKAIRLGIILLKRFDPELPVATHENLHEVVAQLEAARGKKQGKRRAPDEHFSTVKTPPSSTVKTPPSSTVKTPPRSIKNLNENEVETTSSSKRDDDDTSTSFGEAEDQRAAIEAVRKCMGASHAATVEADLAILAKATGGRWDLVEFAAYMAKGRIIRTPIGFLLTTIANFPGGEPSAEARAAKAKAVERARVNAEYMARLQAEHEKAEELAHAKQHAFDDVSAEEMMGRMERAGWEFWLQGDMVANRPTANARQFSPEFIDRLKSLKPELIEILKARGAFGPPEAKAS